MVYSVYSCKSCVSLTCCVVCENRYIFLAARSVPAWIPALNKSRLPTLSDGGYEKRGGTADFSRYTCRFQWSKSTRNLKEEIKRYSPLIEPPSFQWKVKLPLTVASSVSPFYGRPAINAKISERSMFNFVPDINCPWERKLSYLEIDNIFGVHTI